MCNYTHQADSLIALSMHLVPALVISYLNPNFLRERIYELQRSGFSPIYVFIDGCDFEEKKSQNRECLAVAEEFKFNNQVAEILAPQINLGQGKGIPQAIDWFFSHQEFGLILEDDCKISPSLHNFISHNSWRVLDSHSEIAALCGSNIGPSNDGDSIFLSPFFESWGWSTSSYKWSKFYCRNFETIDIDIAVSKLFFIPKILRRRISKAWSVESKKISSGTQDTWALRFTLGIIAGNGRCLFPRENQILHISHEDAIHVNQTPNWYRNVTLGDYIEHSEKKPPEISKRHVRMTLRYMYGISFVPYFWRLLAFLR